MDEIFQAVINLDYKTVNELLEKGVPVDVTDGEDNPLIHSVAIGFKMKPKQQYFDMLDLLLNKGSDVNAQDHNGWTILNTIISRSGDFELSSSEENCKMAKYLIEKGADPNIQDNKGWSSLHCAVLSEDDRMVELLINNGVNLNLLSNNGLTALTVAVEKGLTNIAIILLENGAGPNIHDTNGVTPLHFAVSQSNLEILNNLLKSGADPTILSIDDRNLINETTKSLFTHEVTEINISSDYTQDEIDSFLLWNSKNGDIVGVKACINGGANINCQTIDGWTPLLEASVHSLELVELLLSKGANPDIVSYRGYTPVMRAAGHGKFDIVKCLIDHKADLTKVDNTGQTAYSIALFEGYPEIAKLIGDEPQNKRRYVLPTFEYAELGQAWFDIAKVDEDWFNVSHTGQKISGSYWSKNGLRSSKDAVNFVLERLYFVSVDARNKLIDIINQNPEKTHFTICVHKSGIRIYNWPFDNRNTSSLPSKVARWNDTKTFSIDY